MRIGGRKSINKIKEILGEIGLEPKTDFEEINLTDSIINEFDELILDGDEEFY